MILYLTTADTDILTLRAALPLLPEDFPDIYTANVTDWAENDEQADAFLDRHLKQAEVVIVRLLGGKKAQPHAFDRIVSHCHAQGLLMLAWPGDQEHYPELQEATTVPAALSYQAFTYALYGGVENVVHLFRFISDTWLRTNYGYREPVSLPWSGIYQQGSVRALTAKEWQQHVANGSPRPVIGILFYRAHWMSQNVEFIDDLMAAIEKQDCVPLPIFAQSLKEDQNEDKEQGISSYLFDGAGTPVVDALIVTMSFSVHSREKEVCPPSREERSLLERLDVPVFQALVSFHDRQQWQESEAGMTPLDTAMNIALPEFDGRIITVPFCFKEKTETDSVLHTSVRRYRTLADRVDYVARLAARWTRLYFKRSEEKKIAILLNNSPSKDSRIGNAVGLDTPQSLVFLLRQLAEDGYDVGDPQHLPDSGDELVHRIVSRCSNDRHYLTEEQLASAVGHISQNSYGRRWEVLAESARAGVTAAWGRPPGDVFLYEHELVVPGIRFGNVFVGLQPPRGFGDNPSAIYHDPDLVPTHHYIAYYHWLRDHFRADAVIHVGKHGTLEWLPGKGIGLSEACYPEVVLNDLPNFYPYIINNPGEGTQAKRRSHATIIDHMVPVMTTADVYDELARLEQLLEEYYQVQTLDPKKLPVIQEEIWEVVRQAQLNEDLHQEDFPDDFDHFLEEVDGYICELKAAQIRDGLHILGQLPTDADTWTDLLYSLLQHPNGEVNSLPETLAHSMGIEWQDIQHNLGTRWNRPVPDKLEELKNKDHVRVGEIKEAIEQLSRYVLKKLIVEQEPGPKAEPEYGQVSGQANSTADITAVLDYTRHVLLPRLLQTPLEIDHLLHGLSGHFVPPGPSGAPTRGMADILPTGRNFYSVDPGALPSSSSWRVGQQLADALIERYVREEGEYPRSVGIVVWGTAAMRTRGDDVAQILALLGVKPVWQQESGRVTGLEVIPVQKLGRPRVDVTVRISGFFRDAFPHLVKLINRAVNMVSELPETDEQNPIRKHIREDAAAKQAAGLSAEQAKEAASYRIFGSKPGTYGSGLLSLIESGNWQDDHDLAAVFTTWSSYAYTDKQYGKPAVAEFEQRLRNVQIATKNQDNREHDIFDSDDYFQEHGGMVATIRSLTGKNPKMYFGDSANPSQVRVRHLSDEAMRVFRSRVVNPKWLSSAKRHGYKGALEMANTVDFLFGYDATAKVIDDWMYEKLSQAYALDDNIRQFLQQSNPWALKEMVERLLEAAQRQMWKDPDPQTIEVLAEILLETEAWLEEREDHHDNENRHA